MRDGPRLLVDPGSFVTTNAALVSVDSLTFRDPRRFADRLAEVRAQPGMTDERRGAVGETIITGIGTVEGMARTIHARCTRAPFQ